MSDDRLSREQVADLLTAVTSGFRHAGAHEVVSYPVQRIHELTGWSVSSLTKDLRSRRLAGTKYGNTLGMTPSQLAEAVKKKSFAADDTTAPEDEMAQARAMSRKHVTRRAKKVA